MKTTVISFVGSNGNSLYHAIKEFSVDKIVLIFSDKKRKTLNSIKNELKRFKIPVETIKLKNETWEEAFKIVSNFSKKEENIILDCTYSSSLQAAAISAAFVNGIKAYVIANGKMKFLPTINIKYDEIISKQKIRILKEILKSSEITEEELSKKIGMSLPLISYHLNGTSKTKGLKTMGLVKSTIKSGRVFLEVTEIGKILSEIFD